MTSSEGSRASQRRMVEGESNNAMERRLKLQADLEGMNQRIEDSEAEGGDDLKSEEEGEEVNQEVDESGQSNQDEPMEEAEPQEEGG
ncbi:unnamed protein product [Microthlaspi erraticum]|uniref:Uncharacterized protein n=1 Tax=Microthlaspi erraticum TaxID=1685480 RepID=A0A6D2HRE1_9BRAS|nr:unnamed protein product [Microthlaspi erraticum]